MNVKEALSIIRPTVKSAEGLKQAYREACLKNHPDHGGDEEIMKMVNLAYEMLQRYNWTAYDARQATKEAPLTEIIKEAWDKVKHYPGVSGEVVGTWIWLTGETWRYKRQLKEYGFQFSGNKRAWYYHAPGYRKMSKKSFGLDEIRSMFGSSDLENELNQALA